MSSIPSKAMPHAAPTAETEAAETAAASPTLSDRAAGLAELVREHPKTAIAAGAILAAGAAAAIPLARSRSRGRANGADTGGGQSKKAKKS